MSQPAYIPWRERAFVTVKEAAHILARSPDWVRDKIGEGKLHAYRHQPGGPMVVATWSVSGFIDDAEPVLPASVRRARLYLAIDNT